MNKIILIGNLAKDVELRNTQTGKLVASVPLATNKRWVDDSGQKQERVSFHNLVIWGKAGETFAKWLSKGSKVAIIGEMTYENYEDKNGIKKIMAKVIVNEFEFLGGGNKQEDSKPQSTEVDDDVNEIRIEDIPF